MSDPATNSNQTAAPVVQGGVMPSIYEYSLYFWGQIENDNLIEKELGIKEKNFWFSSAEDREAMRQKLNAVADKHNVMIVFAEYEGRTVRMRTVAKPVFEFEGKQYPLSVDFGYGFPAESAEYMFDDGNYSCDCNRSTFIQRKFPEFSEMGCGDKIKMVSLDIALEV